PRAPRSARSSTASRPAGGRTRSDRPQARLSRPPPVRRHVLLGAAQVLRGIDGDPETVVPQGRKPPVGGELRERTRLVVAALRKTRHCVGAEHVAAAAHPPGDAGGLLEADDEVAVAELDDAERGDRPGNGNRGRRTRVSVPGEEHPQIEVEQLVAVQGEHVAVLTPSASRETQAAPPAEWLRLLNRDDLRAEAVEPVLEQRALAGGAAHDYAIDAGRLQELHLVGGEWLPGDRDERLRPAPGDRAKPLGLTSCEDNRLH